MLQDSALVMMFAVAAVLAVVPWAERLGARTGLWPAAVPAWANGGNDTDTLNKTASVVAELRAFVHSEVEAAIVRLRENELSAGSDET